MGEKRRLAKIVERGVAFDYFRQLTFFTHLWQHFFRKQIFFHRLRPRSSLGTNCSHSARQINVLYSTEKSRLRAKLVPIVLVWFRSTDSISWVWVNTMGVIDTMSPCQYHESLSIPWDNVLSWVLANNMTKSWLVMCDMWHVVGGDILSKIQLPSLYSLDGKVIWRSGQKGWITELINEQTT